MSFSSNELNFLVWRYLVESGFTHTAFLFAHESNLCESEIESSSVSAGALTKIVQRGLYYSEAELCAQASSTSQPDSESPAAAIEKAMIENLSLIEAVMTEPQYHKVRAKDGNNGQATGSGTSPKDNKDAAQRDRDRDARANLHNGINVRKDKMASPRNNGTLGVHGKKQQAAQQAASLTNGDTNGMRRTNNDSMELPSDRVRFLKCHESEVFICAWNPVNDLMASGSGDSTARIWNLNSSEDSTIPSRNFEQRTQVLKHNSNSPVDPSERAVNRVSFDVTSLDWNSNGDLLATGCYDGYARVWAVDGNGSPRCTLGAHKGPIFALKWSEKGDMILSAGVDKTTIIWDANNVRQVQQFNFHQASALDVDWIDDETFASCSTDKLIHVCKIGVDRPVRTYRGHLNEVNAIKYDRCSQRLASCSDDMTLKIWSLQDDKPVHDWKAHSKEIYTIRWSPQGNLLASASFDHTVKLWDVRRGESVRTLSRHNDPVYSVSFSPDGRYLASGCFDRSVFLWDVATGRLLNSYVGDKKCGGIFEVSWNHRGDKVAASASDGTVILLDVRHLKTKFI